MMEELICWNFLHYTMLPIICRKYYVLGRNAIIINIITPQHILDITIYFCSPPFSFKISLIAFVKKTGNMNPKREPNNLITKIMFVSSYKTGG
jgi:hypothetical protein